MAVLLDTVLAQDTAVGTLRRAVATGRVHHAYLFDGPAGVGKELCALGLAQALVCERGGPCGECNACTRAERLKHPDVVFIERGLYEPAQIGRRTPENVEISIDQVRTLVLARAAFPPHEGRAKVFIIRRAEELSTSAANALLKTLEEPGDRTHFVLLSAQPETLLPTILSRTQRVRFAPLPDAVVSRIIGGDDKIARLSAGSVETARALADPEASADRERFVGKALSALDTPDMGASLALAEEAKKEKRERLAEHLEALAAALADRARTSTDREAEISAVRHSAVLAALMDLEANASAQLAVESMMLHMRAQMPPVKRKPRK